MGHHRLGRVLIVGGAALVAGACASAVPAPSTSPAPAAPARAAATTPAPAPPPAPPPLPEAFESEDFIVTFAKPGDTAESFATRYLGDARQDG